MQYHGNGFWVSNLNVRPAGIHRENSGHGEASGFSTTYTTPVWFRFLLPSVADLIFIVLVLGLAYGPMATRLLNDGGIGWHIRNGEQMLQSHSLTRADTFSVTMNGQPWYAWEWLFDVTAAGGHQWLGLDGVVFLAALLIAATFTLLFRFTLERGGNLPVTIVFLVLSFGAAAIHLFARPHIVSWLFTAIWFWILDTAESGTGTSRRLYWLPVLTLLWANLHGGFVLGFALLVLYLLAGVFAYLNHKGADERKAGAAWLRRLSMVSALSLLASLLNPYGYKLHVHIYQYLSNRFLMNHIDEFSSPNFHGAAQQCFAVLLLITMVALASARERPRFSQALVIVLAAYSGLYASRNLPTSSILLTMIAAPLLSRAIADAGNRGVAPGLGRLFSRLTSFSMRMEKLELGFRGHLWPAAAVFATLVVCMNYGVIGSRHLMDAHFDSKRFPVQATGVISQSDIRDPIFAPDYWGGYLIYQLYPRTRVFVDDRHDLYGVQLLKEYLKITRVTPDWQNALNQMQVDRVLTPTGSSLANILKETPQWKLVHEDKTAALFQRSVPPVSHPE